MTLQDEINLRKQELHYFQEDQLWFLLKSMIEVLYRLSQKQVFQDITPTQILINPKYEPKILFPGYFKVATNFEEHLRFTNFYLTTYLCPLKLEALKEKKCD